MIKLATRRASAFQVGVEAGADGWRAAWCFDLPGCAALVPPDAEPREYARLAILEFAGWSHERSASALSVDTEAISIVQVLETGAALCEGESRSTFMFDTTAPAAAEFAHWAHLHDRALDELSQVVASLPDGLREATLAGQRPGAVAAAAASYQRWLGQQLTTVNLPQERGSPVDQLRDAHRWLQGTVCDAPRDLHLRHADETWTVRKVMRRSVWHLRYSTWQLRAEVASLWLGTAVPPRTRA